MKVLTWNILASEWIDNKTYKMINKKELNANTRINRILQYILKHDATIIMLQEVMPMEYKKLTRLFQDRYIITPLNRIDWDDAKNHSGNVTLLNKSEFSNTHMQHYPLEFGVCTKCVYKNKICRIFNIHFNDLSISDRYRQRDSIMQTLEDTQHCIIGGDFNHQYNKNTKFYNISNYNIHNTSCPTYYIERRMNIDNILTKGFQLIPVSQCPKYPDDIENGFVEYGSDHLPIMIELGLPL
jgi:endonuclease/exonuclease/phosphatase family metal-dependent hydrolase